MGTTVITLDDVRALEVKEEQEESILAMLGIIGTFLNLFVIVFVYIYTTLWVAKAEERTSTRKAEVSSTERLLYRRSVTWKSTPETGGENWTDWLRTWWRKKPYWQTTGMHWGDNKGLEDVVMAGLFWKKNEMTWMQTRKLSAKTEPSMV